MQVHASSSSPSWLSLVAETAGVSGAMISRIHLQGETHLQGPARVIVQVLDREGQVIGATRWYGKSEELSEGTVVDVGCDLGATLEALVVGWIETKVAYADPRATLAPIEKSTLYFNPMHAMKLMLLSPTPVIANAA